MQEGVDGLLRTKPGRPAFRPWLQKWSSMWCKLTIETDPPGEATHWTATAMAKLKDISVSLVKRIWRTHVAPAAPAVQAVARSWFVPKLRDIVGLYVDPPAHAIV